MEMLSGTIIAIQCMISKHDIFVHWQRSCYVSGHQRQPIWF